MWTTPEFLDTLTTAADAQEVYRSLRDSREPFDATTNPYVLELGPSVLNSFGRWILCLDTAARLEAYSPIDFSGAQLRAIGIEPSRGEGGPVHEVYDVIAANRNYDVDLHMSAMIAGRDHVTIDGKPRPLELPDAWCGVQDALARIPRGVHGAILPAMSRSPTGSYSSARAQASALLLNQLRPLRHARNLSIDAALAAEADANWTAKRAERLARAQAAYPERGYL